jgi:hypothetical protein
MVGVPAFSITWRWMPSGRIGCPLPCLAFIQRMKREPMATTMNWAVNSARPARTV